MTAQVEDRVLDLGLNVLDGIYRDLHRVMGLYRADHRVRCSVRRDRLVCHSTKVLDVIWTDGNMPLILAYRGGTWEKLLRCLPPEGPIKPAWPCGAPHKHVDFQTLRYIRQAG